MAGRRIGGVHGRGEGLHWLVAHPGLLDGGPGRLHGLEKRVGVIVDMSLLNTLAGAVAGIIVEHLQHSQRRRRIKGIVQ